MDAHITKIQETVICSWKSHFILSRWSRAENFSEAEQMNVSSLLGQYIRSHRRFYFIASWDATEKGELRADSEQIPLEGLCRDIQAA